MTIIGIIGTDRLLTNHIFMLLIDKFGLKGIKLVNCQKECDINNHIEAELSYEEQEKCVDLFEHEEKVVTFKRACLCSFGDEESQDELMKKRAKKALMLATVDWNSNYVISPITKEVELEIFSNTFFISLAVDFPLIVQFSMKVGIQEFKRETRNKILLDMLKNMPEKVEKLISLLNMDEDEKENGFSNMLNNSNLCVRNIKDLSDLENNIRNSGLLKLDSRPNWDEYFMKIARLASLRSNCISRKVGSVIVKGKKIISTGYNGTPKNMPNCFEGGCKRCISPNRTEGSSLEACSCMHAEANAMLFAGIEKCIGGTIYTTLLPCISCTKTIIQCEFKRVVFGAEYNVPDDISVIRLFRDSKIQVDKIYVK
ncbi:DCMP deaminase [Cryptosporidium felis]|nr:DCMP deaminase [Cryptosporidium felis]